MKKTRAQWIELVRLWKESGLSAREFSARENINADNLRNWKSRLNKDSGLNLKPVRVPMNEQFVELVPSHQGLQTKKVEPFELILQNGNRILIPVNFETSTLKKLLEIME